MRPHFSTLSVGLAHSELSGMISFVCFLVVIVAF